MEPLNSRPAVIAISSHVAHGAVGNRAAVFALERLGFPVVSVPTAVLTWHPGDGQATRIVPTEADFTALVDDIINASWLGSVGGVMSGYLGNAGQARAIAALVAALKAKNPKALYLCDPVIGDTAGPYVAQETLMAIRDTLLPRADMATPNRHELGFLVELELSDNAALEETARMIGGGEVLVTSAFAEAEHAANLLVTPQGVFQARHPALRTAPHGTGDILAALYLAHRLDGATPQDACGKAVGSTHRLVEMAAGGPMLPIAQGQAAFVETHGAVTVEKVD